MTDPTYYCQSCAKVHPKSDMRLVFNKGRKYKRCVHSLARAAKATSADREAFGRQASEARKAKSQARLEANLVATRAQVDID